MMDFSPAADFGEGSGLFTPRVAWLTAMTKHNRFDLP